jgi:hypothetical protein
VGDPDVEQAVGGGNVSQELSALLGQVDHRRVRARAHLDDDAVHPPKLLGQWCPPAFTGVDRAASREYFVSLLINRYRQ